MQKFYAPSTNGFYDEDLKPDYESAGSWPADARPVPIETVVALMEEQAAGKVITCDGAGLPVAVAPPPETATSAMARALAEVRAQRAPILDALNGIASRAQRAGDAATAIAADVAANGLLDITQDPAFLAATTYDAMMAAILTQYRYIAAAAPPNVQTAFHDVFAS